MKTIILVSASIALSVVAAIVMRALVRRLKLERVNFRGAEIPAGFGFVLVLAALPVYAGMAAGHMDARTAVFAAAVLGFGIIGLLDDMYGTREAGGFRGHLSLLKQGHVSTGLMKAVLGGVLALSLGFVVSGYSPAEGILNGLLIALSANTLNLLDLRLGRAVSCFWVGLLTLAAAQVGRLQTWPELIPVIVPAVWLTMLDRSAKVMLGDAGSNVLGAVLGLALVYEIGIPAKIVLVIIMVGMHAYSEKYSITKLIEGNRILRQVDRLLGER